MIKDIFGLIILFVGLGIGFGVRTLLHARTKYTGALVITKTEEKTLYSLEIYDFSEIENREEVVFKVKLSEESDRA